MSFFDTTDLAQTNRLFVEAADSLVDWYHVADGSESPQGEYEYPFTPAKILALVMDGSLSQYNGQGFQRVRTREYYFPGGPAIGANDRLQLAGEPENDWSPILRIDRMPSAGEAVVTKVITGRT